MKPAKICFRPGVPGALPSAWILRPEHADQAPPVVAVHGIMRDVERMADLLAPVAGETGRIVVLPRFDTRSWPRYQRAACGRRADWALLRLLETLTDEGTILPGPVDLSGYSGGAQFAHRFAWLYPHLVGRLCATAAGWWTFPDPAAVYPCGLGSPAAGDEVAPFRLKANLRHFLNRQIVVRVGASDTERDTNLRVDADIDANQGPNRVVRAQRWAKALRDTCATLALPPRIDFRTLPGCGHNFADCVVWGRLDRDFVVPSNAGAANMMHVEPNLRAA